MALSAFSKKTAESVVFGAGIIVANMANPKAFNGELTEGSTLLGATSGGCSFSEEIEMIDALEGVDGYSMPVKEAQKIVKRVAKLTTTLKEMTLENLKLMMGAADITKAASSDTMDVVQPRLDLKESDFLTNICVIAPILKEGIYAIVEFDNPLNTNGCNLSLANNESGGAELEITAFGTLENYGKVPYRIYRTKVTAQLEASK